MTAWLTGLNLPANNGGSGWYFNPFSWQLLYTIGMLIYHLSRTAPEKLPWGQRWLGLAIGLIVFGVMAAAPWKAGGLGLNAPIQIWPADKTYLAPLRILNVLALLYVFAFFVSPEAPSLRSWPVFPFLSCGRHSLVIYGFGVVLSCMGFVWITQVHSPTVAIIVNFGGILILFVLAACVDWYKSGARVHLH